MNASKIKQVLHGLAVAVGGAVSAVIIPVFNTGVMPTITQLKTAALIGVGAGIAYLVKNYLMGSSQSQVGDGK